MIVVHKTKLSWKFYKQIMVQILQLKFCMPGSFKNKFLYVVSSKCRIWWKSFWYSVSNKKPLTIKGRCDAITEHTEHSSLEPLIYRSWSSLQNVFICKFPAVSYTSSALLCLTFIYLFLINYKNALYYFYEKLLKLPGSKWASQYAGASSVWGHIFADE